jgi:hypothetical protein
MAPEHVSIMSYIRESLAPSERLLYRAYFHWLHRGSAWVALLIFVAVGVAAVAWDFGWVAMLAGLAGLMSFLSIMVPIWTTEIGVTSQRFIFKRGLIWRNTDELQLRAIEEVNLVQGLPGRLLNYGRLVLHGTGVNDITLPTIADPVALRKALQEAMGAQPAAEPRRDASAPLQASA